MLGGCRAYEPRPLDLDAHREALDARLGEVEAVATFAERLDSLGVAVPERFDPADGLTLAEGEAVAMLFNPGLRVARLDAGVARAERGTAGLWEDPVFGFDGAEILSPASPFEFGLTLGLTLPVSGRLEAEKARAGAALEAELRRVEDAEWNVRARLRRTWAAWSVAQERAALLGTVVGQVDRAVSIAERLEEAGELTRVEARLLRIERTKQNAGLIGARFDEASARLELLALMGLPPETPVVLVPGLPGVWEGPTGDAIGRLIGSNTSLAVHRAAYMEAEERLRVEIRKQYPDITIGPGYGSEDNDDRLLLGFSIPVPVLNANRGGIARAEAERERARAAAEGAFEALRGEWAHAVARLEASRAQRIAFENGVAPMLDEQAAEVDELMALGEVNTLLLLETVTGGLDAKSRLLGLRLDEAVAGVELCRLMGPGPRPERGDGSHHEDGGITE